VTVAALRSDLVAGRQPRENSRRNLRPKAAA